MAKEKQETECSYCPREGYKVASSALRGQAAQTVRYCPREGYKVASGHRRRIQNRSGVTVPVRGIRLHRVLRSRVPAVIEVTVPVRGIRLHRRNFGVAKSRPRSYCPREGYKVASYR